MCVCVGGGGAGMEGSGVRVVGVVVVVEVGRGVSFCIRFQTMQAHESINGHVQFCHSSTPSMLPVGRVRCHLGNLQRGGNVETS